MNEVVPRLTVEPLNTTFSFRNQAYESLKRAITQMDIYGHHGAIRLDERQLSQDLGVSRTPIREAMSLLEQEGFVRTVPSGSCAATPSTWRRMSSATAPISTDPGAVAMPPLETGLAGNLNGGVWYTEHQKRLIVR